MNNVKTITSYSEFERSSGLFESEKKESTMDSSLIEKLVDLVGSEKDVEKAAKETYEELQKSYERNDIKPDEAKSAETLAISALIVKLVEKGKLGPADADDFLEELD